MSDEATVLKPFDESIQEPSLVDAIGRSIDHEVLSSILSHQLEMYLKHL